MDLNFRMTVIILIFMPLCNCDNRYNHLDDLVIGSWSTRKFLLQLCVLMVRSVCYRCGYAVKVRISVQERGIDTIQKSCLTKCDGSMMRHFKQVMERCLLFLGIGMAIGFGHIMTG